MNLNVLVVFLVILCLCSGKRTEQDKVCSGISNALTDSTESETLACERSTIQNPPESQFGCSSSKEMAYASNPNHFVKTLAGIQMPRMLYGTAWKKERTADLVVEAIRSGFKGIDTACQPKHYNEAGVGEALVRLAKEGITRSNLFIQTKFTSLDGQDPNNIPYDKTASLTTQVQQSVNKSLANMGIQHIDSLVLHSPMKSHEQTLQVWRVFEDFVDAGKVRQLGLSNCYNLQTFQKLFDAARIKPAVLQNRLYAETNFDHELREFCKAEGIYYQSFWTLSANPKILKNKNVEAIAASKGKTVAQIFFAYLIKTGVVTPLTGTTNKEHMMQDLEAMDIQLNAAEAKVFEELMT